MVSDTKQEPTLEYLTELLEHVQRFWPDQFAFDQLRDIMYFDEDMVPQEDTMTKGRRRRIEPERMTANEYRREIDLITSLFPYPAEIGVQYVGEGSRRESVAERVEIFLNESIDQLNPPQDAPILRERWQMCHIGRAASLIVPGHMYWWDFPYMQDGESLDEWTARHDQWAKLAPIPVTWVDLPAESTFPASFGRIEEELISWKKVTGYDLCAMFSPEELSGILDKDSDYSTEYTLVCFSNQVWLAYACIQDSSGSPRSVDCMIRPPVEHGLGVPAIQITPGAVSGKKEPGKYWQGVADSSISLIKAANRRLSEASTASKFDSLPIFKMWLQEPNLLDEGASGDIQQMFQGDLWSMRSEQEGMGKEDIQPLFQPQFGEKTLAIAQFALARAERNSGAVEALEGATGHSGEPAWSRNSIIEQAKMKQSRLAQAVAAADLSSADRISRAFQAFGEPIQLTPKRSRGPVITVTPDELRDFRVVLKSEYKMKLPVSRRADIQLMLSAMSQIKQLGLPISPAWVMENVGGIQRPLEEFKRSLTWELLMSPESKAFYQRLLIREAEIDLAEEEGMGPEELQNLIATGAIPADIGQQFMELSQGGSNGLQAQKPARAGIPFSASPGGPQPSEQIPSAASLGGAV